MRAGKARTAATAGGLAGAVAGAKMAKGGNIQIGESLYAQR